MEPLFVDENSNPLDFIRRTDPNMLRIGGNSWELARHWGRYAA
jgi:hypothetical protein